MKNFSLRKLLMILLLLVMKSESSSASHAAGAQLTYTCLGSGRYEIVLTFYRDCYGILPSNYLDIQVTNDCGYPSQTVNLYQDGIETEVPTVCPGPFTTCNGGTVYAGYQRFIYRGIVILPIECIWKIGHGEPARNASISTITGAGSDIQYVYCMINNFSGLCNNSPTFNEDPVFNYCAGQHFVIEPAVSDSERDSLVYELIVPRTGPSASDTVTYLPGYSFEQPLIFNTPSTFNYQSGILEGTPIQNDISVYSMVVNEFRNGNLIGQVERDVMISVGSCTNMIPILSGCNGTSSYSVDFFANQLNCFYIIPVDSNITNLSVEYDYSIPGMAMYLSGSQPDTATFCWTPTAADTLQNPYCLRVKVNDGNCPLVGISARNYYVNVRLSADVDGVKEVGIAIWPNPFNSEINLSSSFSGKVEISLFDIQARQVISSITTQSTGVISMNNIEAGIYLMSIKDLLTGHTFWKRIIKS